MIAMVLAAGRGARLRPLTDSIPKSLVEINGLSLLERHLENLRAGGISDVVINLGWLGEQIVDRVGSGQGYGLSIVYSDERDAVLETGGGIHRALPMLGIAPFLVVNADVYTDMPVPDIKLQSDDNGHLVLVENPAYRDKGDFDCVAGRVQNAAVAPYTFSGVAMYRPEFFAAQSSGRFSIVPLLRSAADKNALQGSVYGGAWADIGTPERLEIARADG